PEPYHQAIVAAAARPRDGDAAAGTGGWADDGSGSTALKQHGLEDLLVYDHHRRKAFVDHFYPVDVTLDDLIAGRAAECGDFVVGAYLARVQRDAHRVAVVLERPGRAGGHTIRIRKTIELWAGSADLAVSYLLDDLPREACLHFAVE